MCGIVGMASLRAPIDPGILAVMRDTMHHRGPDDAGEWYSSDRRLGLAHRRLAIIDLSRRAGQPMQDCTGNLTIVFNGEIYNFMELKKDLQGKGHVFRTNGDTEVILASYREWGTDCLRVLNGMFAFCIYDHGARVLFLARDRAGEKPLYFRHSEDQLLFASELRALMAHPTAPKRPNLDAINYYLAYGHVPCPMSIIEGVAKLPQAHAMTYNTETGSLRMWQYWELPEPAGSETISIGDLCDQLKGLLRDSIRRQLISDVPIAVLLSGGCDSSVITALAREASPGRLKTFTVSFPGRNRYDEGQYAKIVSDHLNTEHTEIRADEPSPGLMLELAPKFDEPCADHAMIPTYLVSRAIRDHAKVALTGDGGDELFGGYIHYSSILKLERARRAVPPAVRSLFSDRVFPGMPVGLRFRNHMIGFGKDFPRSVAHINLFFDKHSRTRLLNHEIVTKIEVGAPERRKAGHCIAQHSLLRQAMQSDFMTTLPDSYLLKVDRASMLASIESRAPLLDYRIVEFAYRSVPDKYKVADGQRKVLLRALARGLLPSTLNLNRKQGFVMPISQWFMGRWGKHIQEVLGESSSGLLDSRYVTRLFRCEGTLRSNWNRLYALTILELWCRAHALKL
ncbi:MAG: asparagine synthase (glutamine-hydrolyzing) [Thermodesulfobacteriota bacterium]